MEYIDVHTASEKWSLSERRITMLCRDGRILGAKKDGRTWLIPSDTEKPLDARTREYQDAEHAESWKLPPQSTPYTARAETQFAALKKSIKSRLLTPHSLRTESVPSARTATISSAR